MIPVLLALATFVSTFAGGIVALKNIKHLQAILGFTAGVIIGVVAFDILPEMFDLVHEYEFASTGPMVALVAGFLLFHVVEKSILMHHAHGSQRTDGRHPRIGVFSALALSAHSFLDGVSIGLGFQVNSAVGVAVAVAVIGHDFADGLNTVTLMMNHKNGRRRALFLLFIDAIAPIAGAVFTLFFTLAPSVIVLYLGFFAGFLLYIGASDILPQAHEKKSSPVTIMLTIFGAVLIFLIARVR